MESSWVERLRQRKRLNLIRQGAILTCMRLGVVLLVSVGCTQRAPPSVTDLAAPPPRVVLDFDRIDEPVAKLIAAGPSRRLLVQLTMRPGHAASEIDEALLRAWDRPSVREPRFRSHFDRLSTNGGHDRGETVSRGAPGFAKAPSDETTTGLHRDPATATQVRGSAPLKARGRGGGWNRRWR